MTKAFRGADAVPALHTNSVPFDFQARLWCHGRSCDTVCRAVHSNWPTPAEYEGGKSPWVLASRPTVMLWRILQPRV